MLIINCVSCIKGVIERFKYFFVPDCYMVVMERTVRVVLDDEEDRAVSYYKFVEKSNSKNEAIKGMIRDHKAFKVAKEAKL